MHFQASYIWLPVLFIAYVALVWNRKMTWGKGGFNDGEIYAITLPSIKPLTWITTANDLFIYMSTIIQGGLLLFIKFKKHYGLYCILQICLHILKRLDEEKWVLRLQNVTHYQLFKVYCLIHSFHQRWESLNPLTSYTACAPPVGKCNLTSVWFAILPFFCAHAFSQSSTLAGDYTVMSIRPKSIESDCDDSLSSRAWLNFLMGLQAEPWLNSYHFLRRVWLFLVLMKQDISGVFASKEQTARIWPNVVAACVCVALFLNITKTLRYSIVVLFSVFCRTSLLFIKHWMVYETK